MALDNLIAKMQSLRNQAAETLAEHRRFEQAVKADRNLSDEGKQAQLKLARANANRHIASLRDAELKAIADKIDESQRRLDGSVGDDVIAYRDAQDRADRINDEPEAVRILQRSIRAGDRSMTNAILRRSAEAGWQQAVAVIAADAPSASDAVRDLTELARFEQDLNQVLAREMAYSTVI